MRIDCLIAPVPFAREAGPPALPFQGSTDRNRRILVPVVPQGELVEAAASVASIEIERRVERAEPAEHHAAFAAAHLRRVLPAAGETRLVRILQAAAYR